MPAYQVALWSAVVEVVDKRAVIISTFGPFSIRLKGARLEFARRAPRKQLQLLKVLIALGGQSIPIDRISELLWPDADGDHAQQALETTLSRLRRLLYPDAVRVRDGRLSIDTEQIWVDALVFRHAVEDCDRALGDGDLTTARQLSDEAFQLYAAPFLEGEFEPAEVIPAARTRLNDMFRRHVLRMGHVLDGSNQTDLAMRLYKRALDIDDCDEEVCQALMRSSLRASRLSEGLSSFEALRDALHQRYEAIPSEESRGLHRQLTDAARDSSEQARAETVTPPVPAPPSLSAPTEPPAPRVSTSERRPVTVVAARLAGFSDRIEDLDVEELYAFQTEFRRQARQVMESHGGVLNGFSGGEVIGLFGVAPANDDDPVRAVRAALALEAAVKEATGGGPSGRAMSFLMQFGIATGLHLVASPERPGGAYHLTGAAVNVASRLVALADPGAVLVSADTQTRVRDFFALEAWVEPSPLADGAPLHAFRVLGQTSVRTSLQAAEHRGFTPFVGRTRERAILLESLNRAVAGNGQIVAVSGEAGAGKSRLVHEFRHLASARGVTVIEGRCQAYGVETSFLPFLNALRQAIGISEGDLPETLEPNAVAHFLDIDPALERYLPHLLHLLSIPSESYRIPESLHGDALRRELEDALLAAVVQQTRRGPVMLILEDLQWADQASDATLRHLTTIVSQHPLLLVVLYRPEYARPWGELEHSTTIVINALDAAQTESMLASLFGVRELPAGLVTAVHARTGGNALFNEEIARSLLETGIVSVADGSAALSKPLEELQLPANVQAVIRTRVDRLAVDEQELLRFASVIGREFDRGVLEQVAGPNVPVGAVLERLGRQDLVRQTAVLPEVQFHFKHVLTQQVIYDTLLLSQRKKLHETAGRAIEALRPDRLEENYEVLAYHFHRGEVADKAIEYLELAARKGVRRQSLPEAMTQFRTAIQLLDGQQRTELQMRHRIRLSLELGHLASTFPSEHAYEILLQSEAHAQRLHDDESLGAIALNLGGVCRLEGRIRTALGHLARAMEIAERVGDGKTLRIAEANYGQTLFYAADFEKATRHLEKSIQSEESGRELATPSTRSSFLALQYTMIGEFERAKRLQADVILAAQAEHDVVKEQVNRLWIALRQYMQGEWADSLRMLDATLELGAVTRAIYIEGYARCGRGMALFMTGALEQALGEFEQGLAILRSVGHRLALSLYDATYAELCAVVGRVDAAKQHASLALAMREGGEHLGEVVALRAMAIAESSVSAPDWDLVAAHISESVRLAKARKQRPDLAVGRFRHAELLHKQGNPGAALEAVGDADALFRDLRMNWWTAQAATLRRGIESGARFQAFLPMTAPAAT